MDKSLLRFIGVGLVGYIVWYSLYQYWLKDHTLLDEYLIHGMVLTCEWVLRGVGFALYEVSSADFRWQIGIANSEVMLQIGAPCDGLVLFALFSIFVVAFPGKWIRKLWYVPCGIVAIHTANLLRVISLTMINFYRPGAMAFNHDYTWTVLIYGFIFWLWFLWADKLSHAK